MARCRPLDNSTMKKNLRNFSIYFFSLRVVNKNKLDSVYCRKKKKKKSSEETKWKYVEGSAHQTPLSIVQQNRGTCERDVNIRGERRNEAKVREMRGRGLRIEERRRRMVVVTEASGRFEVTRRIEESERGRKREKRTGSGSIRRERGRGKAGEHSQGRHTQRERNERSEPTINLERQNFRGTDLRINIRTWKKKKKITLQTQLCCMKINANVECYIVLA